MLPAQYAEQGLCNGRESVRPSVCPIDQQQQRRSAGLLLSALRVGDIDQQLRAPHSAGNVDSVTLRADGGGSTFFYHAALRPIVWLHTEQRSKRCKISLTYDTIRDTILTCARKPTYVSLIYRTEPTTKKV